MEGAAQNIALFFYYAFLDERKALEASGDVYQKLVKLEIKSLSEAQIRAAIVNYTYNYWKQVKDKGHRYFGELPQGPLWSPPPGTVLGPWRELLKKSSNQEYHLYLIWIYVLGFSEQDVASGLGVSEGSVRFRTGRSLRSLGDLVPLLENSKNIHAGV